MLVFFSVFKISDFLIGCGRDDMYMELWRACAGPLVDVPRVDERVFYFPQGHMEQVCLMFYYSSSFSSFFLVLSLQIGSCFVFVLLGICF